MSGDAADDLQVGYRGADVLGGDVAATEPLHRPSERLPKRLGLVVRRIADHHRLAAAERQLGECRLVGHAARQPQRIGDGVLLPGVAPHATAAEGGPPGGVVDRDHRPQAGCGISREDDLLVIGEIRGAEHGHRVSPSRMKLPSKEGRVRRFRKGASRERTIRRSEEAKSELQSLMRTAYAVFCLKKKNKQTIYDTADQHASVLK